jgi:predicted NBD/HSP70 family sugar kinase
MLQSFNLGGDGKSTAFKRDILKYFVANGNSTILELAKDASLSVPTVSKAVAELLEMGYVKEYGKQEAGEGRRPNLYGLNPESGYFVGVEIKEGFVNLGLMNFRGDLVELDDNVPCRIDNTMQSVDELCGLVTDFINKTDVDSSNILNATFCISGRVNSESGYSHTLYNFSEQPLTNLLSERIGYPVCIENDTRAFAYGEYMKGAVEGEKNVLFVNVSWGLGLGIILGGELYKGKSGFAGEFGHTHMFDNDILCHCGKKGCLETEASGSALQRKVRERIEAGETSFLTKRDGDIYSLDNIIDAVNSEDPLCIDVIEQIGLKLGESVANLINIFNPELVVIGGVLARTGDFLLQAVAASVRRYSLSIVNKDTRLCLSKLHERGGIIGCCLLARKSLLG